jgi:uncharacterized surface anchored protein
MKGTKRKAGGALLFAGIVAIVVGVAASPSSAASVTPTFFADTANKTCAELDNDGATIEVKVDPNANGTYNGPNGIQVTISNSQNDKSFDWSSNTPVSSVYVKAGAGGSNFYDYDPSALADTNLQSPGDSGNGISHISFCFGGNTTTSSSTSSTSSTTSSTSSTTATTLGTTTTVAPTTTAAPTTTTAEGVLPTQLEQTTSTTGAVVAGVQQVRTLPRTGLDSTAVLLVLGLGLVAAGTCVLRTASATAR